MGTLPALILNPGDILLRQCSLKPGCRVDLIQQNNGSRLIRRAYDHPVPAYEALLGHTEPALPQIFSCRKTGGLFVVEEEFVDGISLACLLETSLPDDAQACAIIHQVCHALTCLHNKGFIHRDVKPENILLTSQGRVVLLDLDASTQPDYQKDSDTRLLGTVGYAAPEQFGFGHSNVRTDVFGVGVLLNVLCTGRHPSQYLTKGSLHRIVDRCIAVNADKRYASAEILMHHLPATAEATPCPQCGFITPGGGCIHCGKPGMFRGRRRWLWLVPAAILLAAAAFLLPRTAIPDNEPIAGIIAPEEGSPERPLTDEDITPFISTDYDDALTPFTVDGRVFYIHPTLFTETFPYTNHGVSSRTPTDSQTFQITFWEKAEGPYDYSEITDPTLLQQIREAFHARDAEGNLLLDESGQPISTLQLTVRAAKDQYTTYPDCYPALRSNPAYPSWRCPTEIQLTPNTQGFWMITAEGIVNGEAIRADIHFFWEALDPVSITANPALSTPVIEQINQALEQIIPQEKVFYEITIPRGTFTGYIEIPQQLSDAEIDIRGSKTGDTILCGGIHDEYSSGCYITNLHLQGAGKDLVCWPEDSPNAGLPNIGIYGKGGSAAYRITAESFYQGMVSTGRIRTGLECTFRENNIAIHFLTNEQSGGSPAFSSNRFEDNDTALLFECFPSSLTLSWLDFRENTFTGNRVDIENLTGMELSTQDNFFLNENGSPIS